MPALLIATNNRGKLAELKLIFAGLPCSIVSPVDIDLDLEIEENGSTFEENAQVKSVAFARASGLLTLADDSGLEVEALGGEPGVRSARYAGDNATDSERIQYLLSKMKGIPAGKRHARFRSIMAITTPLDLHTAFSCGECRGEIAFEPRGENGFGYDPVFFLPQLGKTMAELPKDIKNGLSHRGMAARNAIPVLYTLLNLQQNR